jgi:HK97 family phage major capsid protein
MSELQSLIEKQSKAFYQFKSANDARLSALENDGHVDPVLEGKVEKANEDIAFLQKQLIELEAKGNRPSLMVSSDLDGPSVKSMVNFMRTGDAAEMKSMSIGTDADGGYAVPTQLDNNLRNYLHDASAMRQISTVKNIGSAKYSKAVNTGGLAAGWVGETDARPGTTTPTIAEVTPPVGELYANPAATAWMLEDVNFDLANWLMEEVKGKFASMEGAAFISGDGTNKPRGILNYPSATTGDEVRAFGTLKHILTTGATSLTADEIINISYDLRSAYRRGSVWVMNSKTAAYIRKLKDSNGSYLWQANFQNGQPAELAGYKCFIDESMPDIATGNVAVMFGNFTLGYEILDRSTMLLRDPYTNKPYCLFYTTKRVSGMVVDSNAIRLLQQL